MAALVHVLLPALLALLSPAIFASGIWERIPIVSQEIKDAGFAGGEGCQVIRDLKVSRTNPDFLIMGTDVGGVYRSLDSGRNWSVAMVGWWARGGASFAIDPFNSSHVLGLGGNSEAYSKANGLYLSVNHAASWQQTQPLSQATSTLLGPAIAFDASSFDASRGWCLTAYFSSASDGLYKSVDGGYSWSKITPLYNMSVLQVNANDGALLVASHDATTAGVYRSHDGGATFARTFDKPAYGMDMPNINGSSAALTFLSTATQTFVSRNGGVDWTAVQGQGLPQDKTLNRLTVSPVNNDRMFLWYQGDDWQWKHLHSEDGGAHWIASCWNNTLAFMPYNVRQPAFAYHPEEQDTLWNTGGDWITKSTDHGQSFSWAANGYNAVMVGGSFSFSAVDPDVVYFAFQDYSGAVSTDAGSSWRYMNVSGNTWGGMGYGGYAINSTTYVVGNAPSWTGKRELMTSLDAGRTWQGHNLSFEGLDMSFGDPVNPSVVFASNWRSSDGGLTWVNMTGCSGVVINSTWEQEPVLLGVSRDKTSIVTSSDSGATWTLLLNTSLRSVGDIAAGPNLVPLFVVAADRLLDCTRNSSGWHCSEAQTPLDQYNASRFKSVAIDPSNPSIVFATNTKDIYASNRPVLRSFDAGRSWTSLLLDVPLEPNQLQGVHEASWARVHPRSGALWVAGGCFGVWKWLGQ